MTKKRMKKTFLKRLRELGRKKTRFKPAISVPMEKTLKLRRIRKDTPRPKSPFQTEDLFFD